MPFWDRFVLWLYLGLGDVLPLGRDAVARLFEHAFVSGQLNVAAVNDATIVLLASACRPTDKARRAAFDQLARRRLITQYSRLRNIQRVLAEPRLTEILEVNRPHQPIAAQLVFGVLSEAPGHEVWINLNEFLARINAVDPQNLARRLYNNLTCAFQRYYRIPNGTVNFSSLLYRHACGYLGVGATPLPVYTSGSPTLAAIPDQDEQDFLVCCGRRLSDRERVLLFLHFYGRLTADQIVGVLKPTDDTWTADLVVMAIERCWRQVL